MRVKDVMTRSAKCVGPTTSIAEAAKLMRRLDIGCVPVGADGRIVGILSVGDIAERSTRALAGEVMHEVCRPSH